MKYVILICQQIQVWYFNLNNSDAKSIYLLYYRILILLAIILDILEYYHKLRLLFTYLVVKFLRIVKCVCSTFFVLDVNRQQTVASSKKQAGTVDATNCRARENVLSSNPSRIWRRGLFPAVGHSRTDSDDDQFSSVAE